ncbi:hypothetical protein TrRE_jg1622 [Triparma retinervis]|uniref:Uncharacterized protein n=1 Tax=Triparma retinervis TaxID=2557542 RepID=A0A9W7E2B0_9STRA|nr:hypothetical protein TrRE_jg1622 [Triparma retinervis]
MFPILILGMDFLDSRDIGRELGTPSIWVKPTPLEPENESADMTLDIPVPSTAMNFDGVPTKKWEPSNMSQKAKYDRLVNNSQPVASLNITPDDCSILPYTHYVKSVPKTDVEMRRWRAAKSRAKERKEVVEEELKKGELTSLLDGFALLEGCGVDLPDKGRRADVSGKGFGGVVEECNGIKDLPNLPDAVSNSQFQLLSTLDLSYNTLTIDALSNLAILPNLTDLDITYNMLEKLPKPKVMGNFESLKYLKAGNNGFESDTVLISLSSCPRLAEVDLSYNYLQRIPKEVIEEGCFTCLQGLNLTYNYIADEEELLPAVLIERLTRLLVYGNPLCGPTGEDESGECVDRVIDASIEARDGWGDHELTVVTVTGKEGGGGASKKKKTLYRDLQMSAVVEDDMPTAAEWRRAGNNARNGNKPIQRHPRRHVSAEEKTHSSATFMTGMDMEEEDEEYLAEEDDALGGSLVVPTSLLKGSLENGNKGDPGKLTAAIHALRYALKSSDEEGLALKINDPRTGVNRANASYRARALPKRPYVGKFGGAEEKDVDEDAKGEGMRAVTPGIINATLKAKEDGKTALHELQEMLETMNDRMGDIEEFLDPDGGGGRNVRTAGAASRSGDRAIKNLVEMVDRVVD